MLGYRTVGEMARDLEDIELDRLETMARDLLEMWEESQSRGAKIEILKYKNILRLIDNLRRARERVKELEAGLEELLISADMVGSQVYDWQRLLPEKVELARDLLEGRKP